MSHQNNSAISGKRQANSTKTPQRVRRSSRLSRDQWREYMKQWQTSGLTQKAFCEQLNLAMHRFTYYRTVFRQKDSQRKQLLPVVIDSDDLSPTTSIANYSGFVLHFKNEVKLEIPGDYNPRALATLLGVLGEALC